MADEKVRLVQQWLLDTYGKKSEFATFVSDYDFRASGIPGNTTATALVYAFQYEIGIDTPSGSFGHETLSKAPILRFSGACPLISENLTRILEGGLWCQGYAAGYDEPNDDFGGTLDGDTINAIHALQEDIGLDANGYLDGYLWKALLSTTAFVTTWSNGSQNLREAQQYLNWMTINGYYFADDFIGEYLPTNGLSGREFSKALIKYIQANLGIYASEATGNLGPSTQAGLPNIPSGLPSNDTTARHFVRAAVFALLANGYEVPISSYWNSTISSVVSEFQRDMALSATGTINFSTWMALLISYGDKNRSHTCCDTRFEITSERLETLKSMGIEAVGRYINGTEFKVLRKGEPQRIIDGGLGLIPIYQENGTSGEDFSASIGLSHGANAQRLAINLGIPFGSTIYFAVDYDAQDWEITDYIIPYFTGIKNNLYMYDVGIYGTRNVCQRVTDSGLSVSSYVSNMSSGYSGNLGFKMPTNWMFDQFDEITIGDWGIDRVSCLNPKYVIHVQDYTLDYDLNSISMSGVIKHLQSLLDIAILFCNLETNKGKGIEYTSPNCVVLNYLREKKYSEGSFQRVLGIETSSNTGFYDFISAKNTKLHDYFIQLTNSDDEEFMILDKANGSIDLGHLAYTILGYGLPSVGLSNLVPRFWTGWGGDFGTLTNEVSLMRGDVPDPKDDSEKYSELLTNQISIAKNKLGKNSTFNFEDICSDSDSIYFGNKLYQDYESGNDRNIIDYFSSYYSQVTISIRMKNYLSDISSNIDISLIDLTNKIYSYVNGLFESFGLWPMLAPNSEYIDRYAVAYAFAQYIIDNL